MKKLIIKTALPALAVLASASLTTAQENQVFIGQTGVTNTINIDQAGQSNSVGADTTTLLVAQDGQNNELDIRQSGINNRVGADLTTGRTGILGVNQIGSDNNIQIEQNNTATVGENVVGAILQQATSGIGGAVTNSLVILQTGDISLGGLGSGAGEGQHRIGEVTQIHTGANSLTNFVEITQRDGGTGSGSGNDVDTVIQVGAGNSFTATQLDSGNVITDVRQTGETNTANVQQGNGVDNVIQLLVQDGIGNSANVDQSGNRNIILSVEQNNALVAVTGNIMTITIGGDDNGGDGLGGLGQFVTAAQNIAVAQAEFTQLGDENNLNFTTAATSEANLFGFVQDGDGNAISGTVRGQENESASVQIGDGNTLDFNQDGLRNSVAVTYRGDNNSLNVNQVGDENTVEVGFEGGVSPLSRSNQNNDPAIGGFSGLAAAFSSTLLPGDIFQTGNLNAVSISVNVGNQNQFAVSQTGNQNTVAGSVFGNANQVLVIQTGSFNVALYSQTGSNNQLIIIQ